MCLYMCGCTHTSRQTQVSVYLLSMCFKSPLGGNSLFFPFLFGCDLGEIDSPPARWMLTVPLIYRVTYAK